MEENTITEVKKTVEDILEILEVVKEDILESVTVIEDGILETVPLVKEDIVQFVKIDENTFVSLDLSENKTMKSSKTTETQKLFQKNVCLKFEENETVKETVNTLLTGNVLPSREDIRSLKELIIHLSSRYSNQIPLGNIVTKMSIHKFISHYVEYRKSHNNDLSKLYNSRTVMDECLEESSFIAEECRITITDPYPTPDVNSMSEEDLKTLKQSLMEKITDYKECLRALCWNLDSVVTKLRLYKKLNSTIEEKRDNFLNSKFLK